MGRVAGTTSSSGPDGVRSTFGEASSGSHRPTGSSSAIRPSSTSIMTAAATIGLVIEAMRKMESLAIGAVPSTSAEAGRLHLGAVALDHQAHRARHRPLADVRVQNLVQVGRHRSTFSIRAVATKTSAAAPNHRTVHIDYARSAL